MGDNEGVAIIKSQKIHPFFAVAKNVVKESPSSQVTPLTPDSSRNPHPNNTFRAAENRGNVIVALGNGQRKRRRTESLTNTRHLAKRDRDCGQGPIMLDGASIRDGIGQEAGNDPLPTSELLDASSRIRPVSQAASEANFTDAKGDTVDTSKASTLPKPQKLLRLNPKTGTIGSPPKPKPTYISPNLPIKKKRGRKPKKKLLSIRYGQEDDAARHRIGQQINSILAKTPATGTLGGTPPSSREADDSSVDEAVTNEELSLEEATPEKDPMPCKATHPFFQGKGKSGVAVEVKQKTPARPPTKRQTIFTSTPCSSGQFPPKAPKFNIPAIGAGAGALRVPGAQYPAWPWEGAVHIRDYQPHPLNSEPDSTSKILPRERKAKGHQVEVLDSESVLQKTRSLLNVRNLTEELKVHDTGAFQPPHPLLRIPSRHFEGGKKLQARIASELKTLSCNKDSKQTHPAIKQAYASLRQNLSAFDRSTCETSAWTQKYSPSSASHVLQSGPEAELLRDWLRTLKVLSINTGTASSRTTSKGAAAAKPRRKRKKLHGFVVSSDEEMDELDEISEIDEDWPPSRGRGTTMRTVIRSGDASARTSQDGDRLTNAVILSGPHGCGKTAAVYAIARELDFEVFEINAGSRRSGKDILERVGDMTRNHLVQHRRQEVALRDEDASADELSQDIKSGRQGMMTAFFKPKQVAAQTLVKKSARPSPAESDNIKEARKSAEAPKQSLILLEEVDVLYEEDKQFWATVISMISQSKRPFVMTCNDETLVPIENLSLHGIFRLSCPPADMAVDLLLLIAANEGHALRRRAVETLYDSRCHDLRASITELNYWCQIGIGDIQGGFNWFYPRWPKGTDVDEDGDKIRVVSQDAYQTGMGWLSRDAATGSSFSRSTREELHQQIHHNWALDTYESRVHDDRFASWAAARSRQISSAKERLDLLESIDAFSSLLSDVDLGSTSISTTPNLEAMDASFPSLPTKAKDDFIIGRPLLEVSPSIHYDTSRHDISTTLKDLARVRLGDSWSTYDGFGEIFGALDEEEATAQIADHLRKSLDAAPAITRLDYSLAFDPIAASEKSMAPGYLDPSVFDRTMSMITLDIAPYVRSIVAYDQKLHQERIQRSSLLSEGGRPGKKRMRTTRSAYSALQGGSRAYARRERYFSADVNPHLVMQTGGQGWDALVALHMGEQNTASSSTKDSCEDGSSD
ncbi:hypothetical protein GGS23DRAFT_580646 [Durotheca rogersii]|uniref:uncharacterized protein n=1 Tax=Durotheca rogersii TaxID=419775 RepID=UPI00221E6941|nr:uncharacterized protein GGS23DRAFT_580646 [Durotheca rogersii]KAI5860569.1 hypothetical protein GGS23DRAFT_580646 [Durotheca rogersii]